MAADPKDPFIGTRVREYEILDLIGKGGMGAVYRARHIYLDEERAIKVIRAPIAGESSSFVDRFIREAKILTKLRHPDLVELYEFGRLDENLFFMVMELMKGESVRDRMKKLGRIPVADSLQIIREAANGLHVAHQRGIIHRDISPDNLMLVTTPEGTEITKVIDFGIAKPLYKETHSYTIGDMFIGKPEFSSPEQCGFHEEGEEIDYRADIYSLAVTLYYILSGKLPFYSVTPQGYLLKHASEPPKPISNHFAAGELPAGVDALIAKALAKRRENRQESMAEFADEIEQIQNASKPTPVSTKTFAGEFPSGFLFAHRYEIEKKLGRGGMGVVYKASDKFLDIPVALKTMNPDIADDERILNRMKREVILARKISHPNVCRIYDIGESDGINYVSMELLEGRTLSEILSKEGAIPLPAALPIIDQILDAIEAAHDAGVLHRDLKPQNIIVEQNGRAHIMDFGISTSADVSRLTQTGGVVGTPRYMAPEQFSGAKVDPRADIYSIGIIIFEMITGALPYEANTPATVMYAHLHYTPRKPSQLVSNFPPVLERVILKALEKDPDNRFQTVTQFRNALAQLLKVPTDSQPAPYLPTSPPDPRLVSDQTIDSGVQPTKESADSIPVPPEAVTEAASFRNLNLFSKRPVLIPAGIVGVALIALIIWFAMRPAPDNTPPAKTADRPAPTQKVEPPPNQQIAKSQPPPVADQPVTQTPKTEVRPPEPVVTTPPPADKTEPAKTEVASPAKTEVASQETTDTEPPKTEVPAPASSGTEYTVEVMASSYKARAEERASMLTEKGFPAFVARQKDGKGTYRVRVGRFSNHAQAKAMADRIKNELQLSPWVTTIPKTSESDSEAQ